MADKAELRPPIIETNTSYAIVLCSVMDLSANLLFSRLKVPQFKSSIVAVPCFRTRWACPVGDLSGPLHTAVPADDVTTGH